MKKNIHIDRLINLTSFDLSDTERSRLEKEIEEFISYAEILDSAPCSGFAPMSHAVMQEHLRDDIPAEPGTTGAILKNAPHIDNSFYIVPSLEIISDKEDPGIEIPVRTDSAYKAVIGLEIHARLETESKLFCSCPSGSGQAPDICICPVCTGQPGSLPVLNRKAVNMAVLAGLAMNCTINEQSVFERKNYFYPDLPKGYQITQYENPLCVNGYINIDLNGRIKKIAIERMHIEEDAGRMIHAGASGLHGSTASAVDFNRSGIPLLEIVTAPVLHSPEEARESVVMLRAILISLGVCDGSMEQGSLRCDANVSVRERGGDPGIRTEIKNMNSLRSIERALEFEIARHIRMKTSGIKIRQETRLWDENEQKTYPMRSKEESHDYRYFPDPDLPPLVIDRVLIEEIKKNLTPLPLERKAEFERLYKLGKSQARYMMLNPDCAGYFENIMAHYPDPQKAASWFFNELLSHTEGITADMHITPEDFAGFLKKIDAGLISGKIGKSVIKKSFETKRRLNDIIESENLAQITDRGVIENFVENVLKENPIEAELYRSGKKQVFAHLVGQVMKLTEGKASPQMVNDILKTMLDKK